MGFQKYINACSTGKADVVEQFLDGGVDVEQRDDYNLTGLMWAGRKGRVEVAKLLLDRGAQMEAIDNTGRTALYHAVCYDRYEFVETLLGRGANPNAVDMHGWGPLDYVYSSGTAQMAELLERFGAVLHYAGTTRVRPTNKRPVR